jgi:nicotinate-nucleotide adenylyltransferase
VRVALMGGTFDPVHYGHLIAAEEAWLRLHLDEIVFVPCGQPAHKKPYDVTPAEERYAMALLATASNPHFRVSRLEIDRPGPSYAIDTIRRFQEQLEPEAELFFVTGADAILEIETWHENGSLLEACRFVAATRPGYDLGRLRDRLGPERAARVSVLQLPGVDISSTALRARVAAGESVRYLTPEPVADYIAKRRLYASSA